MGQKRSSLSSTQSAIDHFAEQSKNDWAAVRTSAYSSTFEELSHYSHCRLSPYMIAVAQALCSQFNLSASTRKELEKVRQKLCTTENDSSDHVLQMLTASDEGLIVLGICGILNDYFHWMALAEFFETLTKMSGMPEALRPARGRWVELARIGGKIQLPDSFHALVQSYSQLGLVEKAQNNDLEEGVGAIGVTFSLQVMSSIHSGEDNGRITSLCGRGAGWHAAVAEWLFGLRIKLTTRSGTTIDGRTVYSNCEEKQLQLILAFNNPGVPIEGEPVDDPPMSAKNRGGD